MNKISFVYRNQIKTIDFDENKLSPTTTLLQYLRSNGLSKGTKEGCNEGDCGACTVVLVENKNGKTQYKAVNSCVTFLPAVHGKQILTIEDLGTPENLHPIQQIFIKEHSSQCGFCTPGFIMSLFAQKAQKNDSSVDELIEAIHGNLCRCTGYRPIVAAAEDLAKVIDLKYFETFARPDLISEISKNKTILIENNNQAYWLVFTLDEALRLKKENPDAIISSGSTDLVLRVTKRKEFIPKIIDISLIEEIDYISENEKEFEIGAGTTIENFYQFSKFRLPALTQVLSRFGAKQIRNRATLGGNIATASPIGDILPILFVLKARLKLYSGKERIIDIEKFITGYRETDLQEDELIKSVIIPKPSSDYIIKTYKISKRKYLDISTVSASFKIKTENGIIRDITIAFGGMAETPKRALETEKFLKDKQISEDLINKATDVLTKEFRPISDARSSAQARNIMAKNILIKFFNELN